MKNILFLCTGNYYRSRYAEELFNNLASKLNLTWVADSRGLYPNVKILNNPGAISINTVKRIHKLGFKIKNGDRLPKSLEDKELERFNICIALDETEHKPYVEEYFPKLKEKVIYWDVRDIDFELPDRALRRIEEHVIKLIHQIEPNLTSFNLKDIQEKLH
ncbi:MAG: low molecular weight phosphatase family protein [Desulfobacterales bacterium]|nr:low molecular weight phosphatase family protein [Desulfobacterales bacterium]